MNHTETFNACYRPLLDSFLNRLKARPYSDYAGIPHVFLPAWGKNYDHALVKMAIIGKETRGWSPTLDKFLPLYANGQYDLELDRSEFQDLDFTDASWMGDRPTRSSFWGFWMNVLAKTYGVENWSELRNGKYDCLLDSFVWGNVNSIETVTSQPIKEAFGGSPSEGYWLAKNTAAEIFDSIDLIRRVFNPDVVVLTCSRAERDSYLGRGYIEREMIDDRVSVLEGEGLIVLHVPHPNNQKFQEGGAEKYAQIIKNLLLKHGKFCPLPDVLTNGLSAKSQQLLVKLCAQQNNKYDAIAAVAHELRRQRSYMTARDLCVSILNGAGFRTNRGDLFTGNSQGPCKLVSAAYRHFAESNKDLADDIAYAFTNVHGFYAYE